MLPLRSHLSLATIALVFVIPVVAGVVIGGRPAGLISVAGGFLVYDLAFIPPYWTLAIVRPSTGRRSSPTSSSCSSSPRSSFAWKRPGLPHRPGKATPGISSRCPRCCSVTSRSPNSPKRSSHEMCLTFRLEGAALLRAGRGSARGRRLRRGCPSPRARCPRFTPSDRPPVALSTSTSTASIQTLALSRRRSTHRADAPPRLTDDPVGREHLPTVANHLALALERAELRERVHRVELLEEIDRLRDALLGAVSHDLRTPLATIKIASSTLLDPSCITPARRHRRAVSADRRPRRTG